MATVRRRRGEWVIDYYDENKQRHILQVESQEEGFKRLHEIESNGRKAPNKSTFKEYCEWWLKLKNCAKGSIKNQPTKSTNGHWKVICTQFSEPSS